MVFCYLTADDGEVFKVKKSSRSKKLMKQLDHERRKKKGEEKMQVDSEQANMSIKQEKDLEIKTDDLVVSYLYDVLLLLEFLQLKSLMILKSRISFFHYIRFIRCSARNEECNGNMYRCMQIDLLRYVYFREK